MYYGNGIRMGLVSPSAEVAPLGAGSVLGFKGR